MPRYSANGTKIGYRTGTTGTFTDIPMLLEVPEFGGTPEKIDVTALSDKAKSFVNGIKDYGDLVFKFLYDNSNATANFRVLKGFETANTSVHFQMTYPDNTAHTFTAIPSVKMDSGAINGALSFSCTMTLQSDIVVTNPV